MAERTPPAFFLDTPLARGLREFLRRLEERLALTRPLTAYLAGGMAVHLYTAGRVTTDIDAEFSARVALPNDLFVEVTLDDGRQETIYLDTNYNASFALMHEDYQHDALPVELGLEKLRLHVLSPVDLAVSKIARLAEVDREDIRALVQRGLTSAATIASRADEAVAGYVGGEAMLRLNIKEAVRIAREVENERRTT